jgi:proline dehydrogenase
VTATTTHLEASRFVPGPSRNSALRAIGNLASKGMAANLGAFRPSATNEACALANAAAYVADARSLAATADSTWLEVDLPHLGITRSVELATVLLVQIGAGLPLGRQIQVGAEDSSLTDSVLDAVLRAHVAGVPVRATVQANLFRTPADAQRLAEAGVPIRIVKGGFPEHAAIAYSTPEAISRAFAELATHLHLLAADLTLATHDVALRGAVRASAGRVPVEVLYGVEPDRPAAGVTPNRVYVPYGIDNAYIRRRIADAARASAAC